MGSEQFFLTNSNGFEITNERGMGIRKTRLGTVRVLRGLNVNVTDGVAIRTAITSSLLPKLLFLFRFQISCLTVRLVSEDMAYGPRTRGMGWSKQKGNRPFIPRMFLVHPLCIHCSRSWVTWVNKTENALALVELTFYLGETDNST